MIRHPHGLEVALLSESIHHRQVLSKRSTVDDDDNRSLRCGSNRGVIALRIRSHPNAGRSYSLCSRFRSSSRARSAVAQVTKIRILIDEWGWRIGHFTCHSTISPMSSYRHRHAAPQDAGDVNEAVSKVLDRWNQFSGRRTTLFSRIVDPVRTWFPSSSYGVCAVQAP